MFSLTLCLIITSGILDNCPFEKLTLVFFGDEELN